MGTPLVAGTPVRVNGRDGFVAVADCGHKIVVAGSAPGVTTEVFAVDAKEVTIEEPA